LTANYSEEMKKLWLEYGHEPDLDPQKTTVDFDIMHQKGWRNDPRE
jgi:hypothetical protein